MQRLPDFLVIGAGKAGTTSLYHYLNMHPAVFVTPQKETSFFSLEGQDPRSFRWVGGSLPGGLAAIVRIEEYHQQFQGANDEQAAGEVCGLYLFYAGTAQRIKDYVPDVKLIAILRDPADRAYSNYQHMRKLGREPLSFADAVAQEPERIRQKWMWDYQYTTQGFYYRHLRHYYERFAAAQIKVFLFEDLQRNPRQLMAEIFDFIGVDREAEIDVSRRRNVTRLPGNAVVARLYWYRHVWARPLRKLPLGWKEAMWSFYASRLTRSPGPMAAAERARLVDMYRADIAALEGLIGRDLSAWLRVEVE